MSTSIYTGASGWGKSYHVMNNILPSIKKAVVFDPTDSFKGDMVISGGSSNLIFMQAYKRFKDADNFKIIVKTSAVGSEEAVFNRAVNLAKALGKNIKLKRGKVEEVDRVQVIIDEATTSGIMSSHYYPDLLRYLVCKGRHDNLDSHLIAQNPMAIHSQIRELCTKVVTFYLKSGKAPILQESFTPEIANRVPSLPKFWRMEASESGSVFVYDEKNKVSHEFKFGDKEMFLKVKNRSKFA